MKISTRLYLAVLPGIVGVFTLFALAYWGEYGRQAPEALVGVAALATAASLAIAWRNARYVAGRIGTMARARAAPAEDAGDELESIERAMARAAHDAEARVQAYAGLLAEAAAEVARRLDEVRLPLHILLENRFGELNENQEEMIAAAQHAALAAHEAVRAAARVAQAEGGAPPLPAPIRPVDLLAPLLAAARARMADAGGTLEADVSPALPYVLADAAHAREALGRLLDGYLARAAAGGALRLAADVHGAGVRIRMEDGAPPPAALPAPAERLLRLQGAEARISPDGTEAVFPRAPAG